MAWPEGFHDILGRSNMKQKSKSVLEFNKIIEKVANFAETKNGEEVVYKLFYNLYRPVE